MWTPRRTLSAETDSPRSTKGPHFMNDRSLVVICWQRLLTHSTPGRTSDWTPLLSTLCPAHLYHLINCCREPLVSLFYQQTETSFVQSELYKLYPHLNPYWSIRTARFRPIRTAGIWVPHFRKADLIGNLGGFSFVSAEHTLFPQRLHLLSLQIFTRIKSLLFYSSAFWIYLHLKVPINL